MSGRGTATLIAVLTASFVAPAMAGGAPLSLGLASAPVGSVVRISTTVGIGGPQSPEVVYNPSSDRYLAVWYQSDRPDLFANNTWDSLGRLVRSDGVPLGTDVHTTTPSTSNPDTWQWWPAAACRTSTDQCLVVWTDFRNRPKGRGADVVGQFIDRNGTRVGNTFRVSGLTATSYEQNAAVAYNSVDDQYLVVFEDYRTGDRTPSLWGRIVGSDGSRPGAQFRIARGAACNTRRPAVVHNPIVNEYLVVWDDGREISGCVGLFGNTVFAQRVAGDGTLKGSSIKITGRSDRFVYGSRVTYNSKDDEYLITWIDSLRAGPLKMDLVDVRGLRLAPDGKRLGVFRITGDTAELRWDDGYSVAYGSKSNEYLVVWADKRNTTGLLGHNRVYGQKVTALGLRLEPELLISGSTSFPGGANGVTFNLARGEYLVIWNNVKDEAPSGIYARRVSG